MEDPAEAEALPALAEDAWMVLDEAGAGFIPPAELWRALRGVSAEHTDAELDEMVRLADANADGQVPPLPGGRALFSQGGLRAGCTREAGERITWRRRADRLPRVRDRVGRHPDPGARQRRGDGRLGGGGRAAAPALGAVRAAPTLCNRPKRPPTCEFETHLRAAAPAPGLHAAERQQR